jgi:5-enolpyruvylshikimate-3-phosphate synthase
MEERPMKDLIEPLIKNGILDISFQKNSMSIPLEINSTLIKQDYLTINITCDQSSQFVTSLLIIAPYLSNNETTIILKKPIVSYSYI